MSLTKQADTTKPAAKPLPQEILYDSIAYKHGTQAIPFRKPVTPEEARAVAFDFAESAAGQLSLDHVVVDASDSSGINIRVFTGTAGLEEAMHTYTITAGDSPQMDAAGAIYLQMEPMAGQPEVVKAYRPRKKLKKLLWSAKSYERNNGIVESSPPLSEKLCNKGIALGQFAAVWTGFYAMKKVFPEQGAPIWLGFLWAFAWGYSLFDGIYRIAHNVPIWRSSQVMKKEEKRKSLAHAVSHEGASKD